MPKRTNVLLHTVVSIDTISCEAIQYNTHFYNIINYYHALHYKFNFFTPTLFNEVIKMSIKLIFVVSVYVMQSIQK